MGPMGLIGLMGLMRLMGLMGILIFQSFNFSIFQLLELPLHEPTFVARQADVQLHDVLADEAGGARRSVGPLQADIHIGREIVVQGVHVRPSVGDGEAYASRQAELGGVVLPVDAQIRR